MSDSIGECPKCLEHRARINIDYSFNKDIVPNKIMMEIVVDVTCNNPSCNFYGNLCKCIELVS